MIAIGGLARSLYAAEPAHYRPNGTPNARLSKAYISCKHVGPRKICTRFAYRDEKVEDERPEQAHQDE